jgi:hypothetical protein
VRHLWVGVAVCASTAWTLLGEERAAPKPHPLDPALKVAREQLDFQKNKVRDYTCKIVKRERINGELGDQQQMMAKIRNRQEKNGQVTAPFSVYLKFLEPDSSAGREVIWVDGKNDGKLIAHEAGLLNIKRFSLAPDGLLAMFGQRYPIQKIGMQVLAEELIAKGERDRKRAECEVQFSENAAVDNRPCRMIQVLHPVKRDHFDFFKAQIFIDRELNVPVRYAAWSWPESEGGKPVLEEEYTYRDVKLNVGLTDKDFDPDNTAYNYPRL